MGSYQNACLCVFCDVCLLPLKTVWFKVVAEKIPGKLACQEN